MRGDRGAIEWIYEIHSCTGRRCVTGSQGVSVLLAVCACWRAIVPQQIIRAEDRHGPCALAGAEIDVAFAAIGTDGGLSNTGLVHDETAGLDEVSSSIEYYLTVYTDSCHCVSLSLYMYACNRATALVVGDGDDIAVDSDFEAALLEGDADGFDHLIQAGIFASDVF